MEVSRDDEAERVLGLELVIYINHDGLGRGVNPISSGSVLHTQIMKTDALKQALDAHGFDAALGGARREEEKSRAKERIFSFRSENHVWNPRNQRPELWNLYNAGVRPGDPNLSDLQLDRVGRVVVYRGRRDSCGAAVFRGFKAGRAPLRDPHHG